LPPLKAYKSRGEALEDINRWALLKGYTFTNAPLKKKGDLTKAIFVYDRREKKQVARLLKESGKGRNKSRKGKECKFSIIC
jgi:hypothetical protein